MWHVNARACCIKQRGHPAPCSSPRRHTCKTTPSWQGNALSLTVRRGASAGSGGIVLQGMGSSARLLVPDVPICGVSLSWGVEGWSGLAGLLRLLG